MAAYIFKLQVTNLSFDRCTFCISLSSVEIHFQLNRYFTTFIVFSTSRLFIYLCTTFIKRIIHNLICSDALCMRNNVQGTFYIMFCKFMQFNKIFKTIFEYIRKKFRFVHTNTFCEYRKKNYAHRLACILFKGTLGEHLMSSGRVFHSVAAAVSINRLPSFTVLLLLGTNDVVFADLRWLQ